MLLLVTKTLLIKSIKDKSSQKMKGRFSLFIKGVSNLNLNINMLKTILKFLIKVF